MSGGLRSVFWGMLLVLLLIFSSSIQTQAVTWTSYGSMYEYTEEIHMIAYLDGKKYLEDTFEDSLSVWNVTAVGDKLYFQTNFTPYFMGLQHFETQQEYYDYLEEHYWYDNDTDSMTLAYSVVGSQLLFIDVNESIISYEANLSNYDIRLLYNELYGLFLPVNHSMFGFKTEYTTLYDSIRTVYDVVFEEEDSFILDRMKYEGYYMSLQYSYDSSYPTYDTRTEYEIIVKYSLKGELYSYERKTMVYNATANEKLDFYGDKITLDSAYRTNGVRRINFATPLIILSSLFITAIVLSKRRRTS